MDTILSIVQRFAILNGLNKPKVLFSSNDVHVLQFAEIVHKGIIDLITTRREWTVQVREKIHTALATEDQGDIRTLCPGFINMTQGTIFNRTTRLEIKGAMTPRDYQAAHAITYTSAYANFRIKAGRLLIYPTVAAGDQLVWEYSSNALVQDSDGNFKRKFTADTDVFVLDDDVLLLWLDWRWRAKKGQPYAEEFQEYERYVTTMASKDGNPNILRLSSPYGDNYAPGIVIPNTWDGL